MEGTKLTVNQFKSSSYPFGKSIHVLYTSADSRREKGMQGGQPILSLPLSFIFSSLLNIGTCKRVFNSHLEDPLPEAYETQQLLTKHLTMPLKFTVPCSLFDTVSKYILHTVYSQIPTDLETISPLSLPLCRA